MLVYNNKLLKVGGKALKFPVPRVFTADFTAQSKLYWAVNLGNFPADFDNSDWEVSVSSLYYDTFAQFMRSAVGSPSYYRFDNTKDCYFFPCFFQQSTSSPYPMTWRLTIDHSVGTLAAGSGSTTRTSLMAMYLSQSEQSNGRFTEHYGTFDPSKPVLFAWVAFNSSSDLGQYNYGLINSTGLNKTATFREILQEV